MFKVGRSEKNTYSRVDYDKEGWADANFFLPRDYDLCHLETDKGKIISGWSIGKNWDGLKIKPEEKIIKWKAFKTKEN